MFILGWLCVFLSAISATYALVLRPGGPDVQLHVDSRDSTNGAVTFDQHSLFVHGQRILFYAAEVHPFRLPVTGLWLDVFQKIRSMGYNGVSFYVSWALVEGQPGTIRANGIFALEPFFDAAKATGIYLLARPGPYINAEVSGGGFPGWLARNSATLRTNDTGFLQATQNYISTIGGIIAKAQITNGGPVILVQPENEYSTGSKFPQPSYFAATQKQLRDVGIVVPLISNDARPDGNFAPGPPAKEAAIDIYGHDAYPLGFNCRNPTNWPNNALPTNFGRLHQQQSSSTPYSLVEFQGGSFDPWSGAGFENCAALLNHEFQRVFYKNNFSFGVTIFCLYMTYGGTNWGNQGHPGGYSSYDYGASITEERLVSREKYSGAKLLAVFLQSSPAYLTAVPQTSPLGNGAYTGNSNVFVSALFANTTKFFVARQSAYNSQGSVTYNLTLPTSQGNVTVPQLGGSLSINGRDSKVHVTDYSLGSSFSLLYSTAEIFTWQQTQSQTVLVVYAGPGETHELAVVNGGIASLISGTGVQIQTRGSAVVINFAASTTRRVVKLSRGLLVYIVDRNSAYNYWVIGAGPSNSLPIVNMPTGYLLRSVNVAGSTVALTGDLNRTTTVEVIAAPSSATQLTFNNQTIQTTKDSQTGALTGSLQYASPSISLPDLSTLSWKSIDSLPEIQPNFDDSKWPVASLTYTNNTARRPLDTPTNLYAADYGFHTGSLVYRGRFVSDGSETTMKLSPQGGFAFGYSVWLNSTFITSFNGRSGNYYNDDTFNLPTLRSGSTYVLTVLIDHMGHNQNYNPGYDSMKEPRGIMQYTLGNRPSNTITWKLTGNLGGEAYADLDRGPLNEGGMWAERQGYHLPGAPTSSWNNSAGPSDGLSAPGVKFFSTTFNLNMPRGYDIPIALDFGSVALSSNPVYRCQVFVNGYQYGKLVSNIGPQTKFPVPQGIWNYNGANTLVVSLWALSSSGAKVSNLKLVAGPAIQSGYGTVSLSPQTAWTRRQNAY